MYNQNIKKNDIDQVINNLEKYYNKVEYLKELKKEKIKIKDEIIIIEGRNYEKEYIVYNYLEYWNDLRYVVIYSDQLSLNYSEIKSIISEYGEILVERLLKLKKDELQGILYWENKRLNPTPTSKNLIVYFYNKRQDKLTDDLFFMKERIIQSNNKLIISIGENTRESLSYAALLLNPSNFDYFNNMNFDRFMKLGNSGKVMCTKLRDYLQRNVSNPLDMKRFLFFSSIILYLYGLRKPNDIDIIGYELPPAKGKTHNLFETFGSTGKNILNIGELSVKGYGNWQIGKSKEYLNNWFGYEWPNLIGATDMADMIFNPRYYLSLMGIKIITIKGDMERRKIRYRATSYADMIGYNFYLKDKILIEEPPYKYIVQGEERSYETKEEILLLLKKIKNYLKMRYNIRMNTLKLVTMLKIHINRWNPRRSRVKDR
jgi:hypothetical protein